MNPPSTSVRDSSVNSSNTQQRRKNDDEFQSLTEIIRPVEPVRTVAEAKERSGKITWIYMTPLIAAPLLPLVRHMMRGYPRARNYVFFGGIGAALIHGIALISKANKES
eukprot:TRINITY_DN4086_c0_g1_i4.p1 TRINITY_DN4086_c0_g1~~TRINITY_DN4086_c0_g1_i4.p1  ORF type:complete len:109 (-),score=25.56 TRINITY_DN4086_c0_g1_i4:175-501(-)